MDPMDPVDPMDPKARAARGHSCAGNAVERGRGKWDASRRAASIDAVGVYHTLIGAAGSR